MKAQFLEAARDRHEHEFSPTEGGGPTVDARRAPTYAKRATNGQSAGEAASSAVASKDEAVLRTASIGSGVPEKRNYTLKEAALYLNVSTRTVERLIQRRLLRRNRALRKILIPRTELDQFIEKNL